ncbi:MAG: universal stress protein, partial [Ktedonobacteraceae bacterium]
MFEHILVPLDGSTRAETALPIAARIARAAKSSVVLLQVVSMPKNPGYSKSLGLGYGYGGSQAMSYGYGGGQAMSYGYGGGLDQSYGSGNTPASTSLITEELKEIEQADATSYLTGIANSDLFADITTTTEVAFGLPAPHILAFMEQQAVNLIVLCSHGRTGFTRWVLGSVAQRVIHHSRVPMLVLHEEGPALPALHVGIARPLCATVA